MCELQRQKLPIYEIFPLIVHSLLQFISGSQASLPDKPLTIDEFYICSMNMLAASSPDLE
ncbi:hypothetical protein EPA93_36435 [Ktedonosporobacter rubrisoli]|uniref:Uncharacterized protein n=1 Tax=Ktedonosporobacter rubrisoli TaxID=2509675 RepID=A0A4P6K0M0_KTERU|nr:hypothetical protein [Ktedonosporobacter rubrisoli]QBD81170.1 hypothetical protein EPA93_36435 [Ktedonosporobacter rubrisoli]